MDAKLENVTVVGRLNDGKYYFAGSHSDKQKALWDVKQLELAILGL